jgi:predicted acyl esterase
MRSVLAVVLGLYATLLWTNHPFRRTVKVPAHDGVHLAGNYYTSGNSGPGILLFHQCTRDRLVWDELATTLANSGNQVLVLNPRGIGDSEGEQWDYEWQPRPCARVLAKKLERRRGIRLSVAYFTTRG